MIILQQEITSKILNFVIGIRNRVISEQKRKKLFKTILVLLFLIQILISYLFVLSFMVKIILFTMLLGIVLIFAIPEALEIQEYNKIFICPVYIIACSFLVTGIITKTTGYIVYSVIFFVIIPTVIMVFSSLERERLYMEISEAISKVFCIVLIVAFFIAPILNAQYCSIFGNPNALSNFLSIVLITQLYLLEKKEGTKCFKYMVFSVISLILCFYSAARTGMLSMVLIFIVYMFYLFKNIKSVKNNVLKLGSMVILSCIFYFLIFFLFTKGTNVVLQIEENLFGNSYTVTTPLYTPGGNGKKGDVSEVDVEDMSERIFTRMGKGVKGEASFTSGRVDIWKDYIKNIGIIGHRKENRLVKKEYYSEPKWCYAHNSFLQLAYSGGLLAGISLFVLWCILGIMALKERVGSLESMMFLAFLLASGLQMMLGSNYSPHQEIMHLVVWIVVAPALKKKRVYNQGTF